MVEKLPEAKSTMALAIAILSQNKCHKKYNLCRKFHNCITYDTTFTLHVHHSIYDCKRTLFLKHYHWMYAFAKGYAIGSRYSNRAVTKVLYNFLLSKTPPFHISVFIHTMKSIYKTWFIYFCKYSSVTKNAVDSILYIYQNFFSFD